MTEAVLSTGQAGTGAVRRAQTRIGVDPAKGIPPAPVDMAVGKGAAGTGGRCCRDRIPRVRLRGPGDLPEPDRHGSAAWLGSASCAGCAKSAPQALHNPAPAHRPAYG